VNCWDKENIVITPDLPGHFGAAKNLNDAIAAQGRLVEFCLWLSDRSAVFELFNFGKTGRSR